VLAGRLEESEEMHRTALEGRQSNLGDHPDTYKSMTLLANLYEQQGDHNLQGTMWAESTEQKPELYLTSYTSKLT